MARPPDHGSLGRCRSRCGGRIGCAEVAGLPRGLSRARESHQSLREPAPGIAGSSRPEAAPRGHRQTSHRKPGINLGQLLSAEGVGSLLLAATVIGSGVMAERLAGGNVAIALLANTGATVAILAVLIAMLGPISGAHFNPAVSLVEAMRGQLTVRQAVA